MERAKAGDWIAPLKARFVRHGRDNGPAALEAWLTDFRQYALTRWSMNERQYESFAESVRREVSEPRRSA